MQPKNKVGPEMDSIQLQSESPHPLLNRDLTQDMNSRHYIDRPMFSDEVGSEAKVLTTSQELPVSLYGSATPDNPYSVALAPVLSA